MLDWPPMRIRTFYRHVFPMGVCALCYAGSWVAFRSGPAAGMPAVQAVQVAAVIGFQAAATFAGFLAGPSVAGAAAALDLAALSFVSNAAGADPGTLAFAAAPAVLLLGLSYSAAAAIPAALLFCGVLGSTFGGHSAWGRPVPAATPGQAAAILSVAALAAAFGIAFRAREDRLERLEADLERMDAAYRKVADANLDFQTVALFAREEAMERERRRLAGEVHDIVGYTLTNLIMLIQAALYAKGGEEAMRGILRTARDHADEGLGEARRALAALRERNAERPRGANLFLRLARTFQDVTGVEVNVDFGNMPPVLSSKREKAVYRLMQEGLTNAFRHGKAKRIDVGFWREGDLLRVRLRDDGNAPEPDDGRDGRGGREGIGLAGLRERLADLGGTLEARRVNGGFALDAEVPLGGDEDDA